MICSYALSEKEVIGGIETHTDGLSRYLSKHDGIELYVITFGDGNKQFKKANLKIYVISKALHLFSSPIGTLRLQKIIRKINPDIILVHGTYIPYSFIALFFRRKYPMVLTIHGVMKKEITYHRRRKLLFCRLLIDKVIEKYVVNKIQNIIAVSLHIKNEISNMTKSTIRVIQNGIDFEAIQNVQQRKSLAHPCILFIGELSKLKGVDLLIQAIPIIKKVVPNIHVFIGGTGPQAEELKELVKELKVEKNAEFLGFVSGDEKYSYYKSADICAFPSTYDPFGIVVLEAMACGKPVIVSCVNGVQLPLPFMMEDGKTGLLFKSGNIEDLAEKVIILLENEELRKKMGDAGRASAKEFSWDKIAEQTIGVYKSILEKAKTL